jgi:hypothetical protein
MDGTEPVTESNKLPKLTTEIFDRPDCPKWAKWVAVDMDGIACYFSDKPTILPDETFWARRYQSTPVSFSEKYEASDWKKSLIERPAVLPDWCKQDAWIYDHNEKQYAQVKDITGEIEDITLVYVNEKKPITKSKKYILDCCSQARLRPYNAEEIPDLPFEVTDRNYNSRTTVVSCQGNNVWLGGASTAISTEELMRDFTAKGSPCGKLEHIENGEWVE